MTFQCLFRARVSPTLIFDQIRIPKFSKKNSFSIQKLDFKGSDSAAIIWSWFKILFDLVSLSKRSGAGRRCINRFEPKWKLGDINSTNQTKRDNRATGNTWDKKLNASRLDLQPDGQWWRWCWIFFQKISVYYTRQNEKNSSRNKICSICTLLG